MQWDHEVADHISSVLKKERERERGASLKFFIHSWILAHGISPPTFKADFPHQLNDSWNTYTQRSASKHVF